MNVMIVEDNPRERTALVGLCETNADLRVVGEAESGAEAVRVAAGVRPDLIILDNDLPDMNGFEVLRALRNESGRRTIMLTKNSRDSATALAAGALDCVTKPVRGDAFTTAVFRARERHLLGAASRAVNRSVWDSSQAKEPSGGPVFLVGERERCLFPIDPNNIDYIESAGNYVKYRVGNLDYIARESIKQLEELLRPLGFFRIERSRILNIRSIAYAQPAGRGIYAFTLVSGVRFNSGYSFRSTILKALPLRGNVTRPSKRSLRSPGPSADVGACLSDAYPDQRL